MVIENGVARYKYPQYQFTRSQDLEPLYHDAGQFYCYQVQEFLKSRGQIVSGIVPFIVDEMEVQDIDNETDWKLAELKYSFMHSAQNEPWKKSRISKDSTKWHVFLRWIF